MLRKFEEMSTHKFKSLILFVLLALSFSFLSISCAKKAPLKPTAPPPPSSTSPEAAADAALGTLPEEGKTEAEKKLRELGEEDLGERALRELRRKEREEEEQRVRRAITEDQILAS